jgi:hypothetical protein
MSKLSICINAYVAVRQGARAANATINRELAALKSLESCGAAGTEETPESKIDFALPLRGVAV